MRLICTPFDDAEGKAINSVVDVYKNVAIILLVGEIIACDGGRAKVGSVEG